MADTTLLETSTETPTQTHPGGNTQQQTTQTEPTGLLNADGTFRENWLEQLPEDLAEGKPTLGKYKSFTDLAKAHVSLQSLMGKKSSAVTIPGENSTPEEIAAYRKAVGVPETPAGYQIKPEQLPEGVEWSDDMAKGFADVAHKFNIPNGAMKALVEQYVAGEQAKGEAATAAITAQREASIGELKKEFGGNFDKNLQTATRMAKALGVDAKSPGFGDPNMVRAFVRMAGMVSEDKLAGIQSTATSQQNWKDIMTNADNPLHKKYHAGDAETVKYVRDLMSQSGA